MCSGLKYSLAAKRYRETTLGNGCSEAAHEQAIMLVILDRENAPLMRKMRQLIKEIGLPGDGSILVMCSEEAGDNEDFISFSPADLNWRGRVKKEAIVGVLKMNFEVLLCYAEKPNALVDFISRTVRARLKIGRKEISPTIYDLSIASRFEEDDVFIEEAKKYLKILNIL